MLELLNKIGQRRFAKWVTIISILGGILTFYIQSGIGVFATFAPYFGVFLLGAPHQVLYLVAEKSKVYRLFSVFASVLIVLVNFILFFLEVSDFLFVITLLELLLTIIFYVAVVLKGRKGTKK